MLPSPDVDSPEVVSIAALVPVVVEDLDSGDSSVHWTPGRALVARETLREAVSLLERPVLKAG